jgi:hypothetical protein
MPETAPTLTDPTAMGTYRITRGISQFFAAGWKHWLGSNGTELKLTVLVVAGVVLAGVLT